VEEDEAGKLRAFRSKFGTGWDAESAASGQVEKERESRDALDVNTEEDNLLDLITTFSQRRKGKMETQAPAMGGNVKKAGEKGKAGKK